MKEMFEIYRNLTFGGYLIIIESAYANARRYMGDFFKLDTRKF